jgi:hypothetical protein
MHRNLSHGLGPHPAIKPMRPRKLRAHDDLERRPISIRK